MANTNDDPTLANAIADQSINEDSAFSFTVPADTFNDVDVGDSLTYTATLSNGSALPSWLSFDAATQTFSGTPLNGDVGSITITVTATDAAGVAISDTFAIAVDNTNDDPTAIALSATAIDENAAGAIVGTLTTTDVDAGDTHEYTLSGTDASLFEIVNGQLKLKDTESADYETQTSYSVTVTATDTGELTTEETFTVTVNNLNDNDPVITSASSVDMAENTSAVITVTATDADGDNLTYSITGGADSSLFTIDSTTGALTLQAKTKSLTTTDSTLPVSFTNMVDNGDGTFTADIEVHPSVVSFAALNGFTIWFSFDSSEMSFSHSDVAFTLSGGFTNLSTLSDGRIAMIWATGLNTLEAGKIGTITFTPAVGSTDPAITIEAKLAGGDKDSIDATNSSIDTSIYNFTIVRTNIDFETKVDANTDGIYEVTIQVSDGERTDSQDILVTVTDVAESSVSTSAKATDDPTNDDTNPTTPSDDNDNIPAGIDLPDFSLWVNEFALGFITLPETVTFIEDSVPPDLSDLIGLIGDQGESLALDFDQVDTGSSVVASVESVKPVIVDWIAHTDPMIDSDWNPIIEELYYSFEVL